MNWYNILEKVAECQGYKFEERPFQKKMINELQKRFEESRDLSVPVLIRLPCGYGKTQIGESPFLGEIFTGEWFTRGMIYVLPTRSLTVQQTKRIKKDVECLCQLKSCPALSVSDFHGESGTYYFYADAIISTFDTFVYAYARKSRTGHHLEFPAGSISTSYIIFDEAHMIQDDYLYSHAVMNRVLRVLSRSGVPTIIMTATMPKPIKRVIFDGIDYEEYPKSEDIESKNLPSLGTYRGEVEEVKVHEEDMIDYIRKSFSYEIVKGKRILVVCNTVRKAQDAYWEIIKKVSTDRNLDGIVILLHSRYIKRDRERRSNIAIKLMKKPECESCKKPIKEFPIYMTKDQSKIYCSDCASSEMRRLDFVIVVATQVVEAGLDISADWLLTDIAPLDALVQRSGRCSRFTYEKNGRIDLFYYDGVHLPYQKDLVKRAYEILSDGDDEHRVRSLTDFVYSIRVIDEDYEVFRQEISEEDFQRSLRLYLSYLEGSGFSTFSIDWQLLRRISARPNAFITLIAFPKDEKIPIYELEEDEADLHIQGKYRSHHPIKQRLVDYQEMLSLIGTKNIGIKEDFIHAHSFTLSYPYALRNRQPKSFLRHRINKEHFMVELRPIIVDAYPKRECCYLVEKTSLRRLEESNYLVNPEFYDEVGGLKVE